MNMKTLLLSLSAVMVVMAINNDQIENPSNSKHSDNVRIALKSQINDIVKLGHKLILVYPVPEMSFIPKRLLWRKYLFEGKFEDNSKPILSESYEKFKSRNELIFEILDGIQGHNIYRVYPHRVFCDKQIKDRCVANDQNDLFYFDDNHLSLKGSEFVVEEIMKQIKKIQFKSN